MRPARRTQCRAFDQEPVDPAQALILEHVLEAEPRAPVGPQVPCVEKALAIGLDEQRARIGRRVVHRDRGHREVPEPQRFIQGEATQVCRQS